MRERLIGSREALGEDGTVHRFDYSVVVEELETGGRFACESYGVKVAEQGGDTAVIPHVTLRADKINGLMAALVDGVAAPASVRDVIEDWL